MQIGDRRGTPAEVRHDPRVLKAYLGAAQWTRAARCRLAWLARRGPLMSETERRIRPRARLDEISFEVRRVRWWRCLRQWRRKIHRHASRHRSSASVTGSIVLDDKPVEQMPPTNRSKRRRARARERQVFPELSVLDNIMLGAHTRRKVDREAEVGALLGPLPGCASGFPSERGCCPAVSSRCSPLPEV